VSHADEFLGDPAGRQNEIHAPGLDSAFRHSRKAG